MKFSKTQPNPPSKKCLSLIGGGINQGFTVFNIDKNDKTINWNYENENKLLDELEDSDEFIEKSEENKIYSDDITTLNP